MSDVYNIYPLLKEISVTFSKTFLDIHSMAKFLVTLVPISSTIIIGHHST